MWRLRNELFPNLLFGMDVEENLMEQARLLSRIVKCLKRLDCKAQKWKLGGHSPGRWHGVTDESESVKNDPRMREARRFRSRTGERLLFLLHAKIGDFRVHLREDDEITRVIEIGYIGPHLPTQRFPK